MLISESNKCLESSIRKCRFLLKVTFIKSPAVEENQKITTSYAPRLMDYSCWTKRVTAWLESTVKGTQTGCTGVSTWTKIHPKGQIREKFHFAVR